VRDKQRRYSGGAGRVWGPWVPSSYQSLFLDLLHCPDPLILDPSSKNLAPPLERQRRYGTLERNSEPSFPPAIGGLGKILFKEPLPTRPLLRSAIVYTIKLGLYLVATLSSRIPGSDPAPTHGSYEISANLESR